MACNTDHFDLARTMALKSEGKYRLGAVIVQGSKVISAGFNNMSKTHPLMQQYNPHRHKFTTGTHAEVQAMIGTERHHLRGANLYVCRILKNGQFANARPCQICHRIINIMGIAKVYYTYPNEFREIIVHTMRDNLVIL